MLSGTQPGKTKEEIDLEPGFEHGSALASQTVQQLPGSLLPSAACRILKQHFSAGFACGDVTADARS